MIFIFKMMDFFNDCYFKHEIGRYTNLKWWIFLPIVIFKHESGDTHI